MKPLTHSLVFIALCFANGDLRAAQSDSPFSIGMEPRFTFRLNGRVVAVANTPEVFEDTRIVRDANGVTALGAKHRQEVALFDDRLEYTYDCRFSGPVAPWRIMHIPLEGDDEATLVYGTYERPPQTRTVRGAGLPATRHADEGNGLKLVRYIQAQTDAGAWSLDCWPRGAMGYVPADAANILRCMYVRPVPDGIELWAEMQNSRAAYNAQMREKFIFYADGRRYQQVHPFHHMNYRFAFEKVVRLDFNNAPAPKKVKGHAPFNTQAYDEAVGHGWVSDPKALKVARSSLDAKLIGERVESDLPGRFRIDLPPGHYYVTLNLGSADAATGPMDVTINGKKRRDGFRLDKGRFRAEISWVTSTQDHLELRFGGVDGASWAVSALTVSSLGTLNEDFALTRPWWHFLPRN